LPARLASPLASVALICATAAAGCGLGPGDSDEGVAELTVTRDFGAERLLEAEVEDPTESETVVRFLDREAEIETSYSGNFVDAIEGVEGSRGGGSSSEDWFFYVNGYWSPVGAGEATVRAGDRIWWDFRDWDGAYEVPAVVGSWPAPFSGALDGRRYPTRLDCSGGAGACERVSEQLERAGVEAEPAEGSDGEAGAEELRILVGPWEALREDRTAELLRRGPGGSGVYSRPARCADGWGFELLDPAGEPVAALTDGWLIAAVRREPEQPTWVITASSPEQLVAAAASLDGEALADAYALAGSGERSAPLPLAGGGQPLGEDPEACR
jgi:hypothetical protein